jgi:hypothetical protein
VKMMPHPILSRAGLAQMRFRPLAWKHEKARTFDRSFGVDGPCQESQLRADGWVILMSRSSGWCSDKEEIDG